MLSIVCLKKICSCSVAIELFIFFISFLCRPWDLGLLQVLARWILSTSVSKLFMSSCALKWNATLPLGRVCMLDVNLLRRDFVCFSFHSDWISRFGVVCGDIVNYTNKVWCCSILCSSGATIIDWIVDALVCNRVLNFW